jgi:hypothetical protein
MARHRGRNPVSRAAMISGTIALLVIALLALVALRDRAPGHALPVARSTSPLQARDANANRQPSIPGYPPCTPRVDQDCVSVRLTLDRHFELGGPIAERIESQGIPPCPATPSLDPGFSSAEEAKKAIAGHEDDPDSCFVPPSRATIALYMSRSDAAAFHNAND